MVSVGTIVWLASELMFFAALFASYYTIRAVSPDLWTQETAKLNVPFASVNTTVPSRARVRRHMHRRPQSSGRQVSYGPQPLKR